MTNEAELKADGTMKNVNKTMKLVRRAFTLVEMLIAMALTLILVYSIAEFYAYIGNHVRDSRAVIEMGSQLRGVAQQLNDDLNSLTLRPEPWIDSASSPGYFTVYEGPYTDAYPDGGISDITLDSDGDNIPDLVEGTTAAPVGATTLIGDGDDILAMTIRAKDTPFQAQAWNNNPPAPRLPGHETVVSQYAEVIWFVTFDDRNGSGTWEMGEPRMLCRRLLLIVPGYPLTLTRRVGMSNNQLTIQQFMQEAEVSFHVDPSGQPVANSLTDLAFRHNRFGCQFAGAFPSHLAINPTSANSLSIYSLQDISSATYFSYKFGEDRVLSNLLAFDVRVYDPTSPIYSSAGNVTAVAPGDFGFPGAGAAIGYGAWVDLSYNRSLATGSGTSYFSGPPPAPFVGANPYNFHTWDTWSLAYELGNIGGSPGTGLSVNGIDDPNPRTGVIEYGVDDAGERQTQPPYASQLRGVQVRLKIYEPQTRQAKQVTVGADFVAE